MSYVTVYEITKESFLLSWRFPYVAGTLIFGVFALIFHLLTRDSRFVSRVFRSILFLFACLWATLFIYDFRYQRRFVQAYQTGKYSVIEGPVEEYSWKGKTECFRVRVVKFCRGTASPALLGWPIGLTREGTQVQIAYSPGEYPKILRLEIGRNSR